MKQVVALLLVADSLFALIWIQPESAVEAAPRLQDKYTLCGAVRDEGSVGVGGVTVTLLDPETNKPVVDSVTTDDDTTKSGVGACYDHEPDVEELGRYRLDKVLTGSYKLNLKKDGYREITTTIVK